jgi:hypothetical protein
MLWPEGKVADVQGTGPAPFLMRVDDWKQVCMVQLGRKAWGPASGSSALPLAPTQLPVVPLCAMLAL